MSDEGSSASSSSLVNSADGSGTPSSWYEDAVPVVERLHFISELVEPWNVRGRKSIELVSPLDLSDDLADLVCMTRSSESISYRAPDATVVEHDPGWESAGISLVRRSFGGGKVPR